MSRLFEASPPAILWRASPKTLKSFAIGSSTRTLRSARKSIFGLRVAPRVFQRADQSFQATWNATAVFPDPVHSVSRMRLRPETTTWTARLTAISW